MNAAADARVSTDKQDLEVQLQEIRQFVDRRGWTLVATHSDVASGFRCRPSRSSSKPRTTSCPRSSRSEIGHPSVLGSSNSGAAWPT
jgi:resolvase-like protein